LKDTGSTVVLDALAMETERAWTTYFTERARRDRQSVLVPVAKNVAAVGELLVFGMPSDNAAAFVGARGRSVISDLGSAELAQKYLPKAYAMPSPSVNRLCVAEIK
jgi:hypothetical protein